MNANESAEVWDGAPDDDKLIKLLLNAFSIFQSLYILTSLSSNTLFIISLAMYMQTNNNALKQIQIQTDWTEKLLTIINRSTIEIIPK